MIFRKAFFLFTLLGLFVACSHEETYPSIHEALEQVEYKTIFHKEKVTDNCILVFLEPVFEEGGRSIGYINFTRQDEGWEMGSLKATNYGYFQDFIFGRTTITCEKEEDYYYGLTFESGAKQLIIKEITIDDEKSETKVVPLIEYGDIFRPKFWIFNRDFDYNYEMYLEHENGEMEFITRGIIK